MAELKTEKEVMCDVCVNFGIGKGFKKLIVYNTDYEEAYIQQAMSDCEKEMDVCNDCILNLNFREVTK